MGPRRITEGVTGIYRVESMTREGDNTVMVVLKAGNKKQDYWSDGYGILHMRVPYDRADEFIPGTVCEVTLTTKRVKDETEAPSASVIRSI